MCGIIGYAGHRPAVPVIMEGLRRLEYRGYDSSGLAFSEGKELRLVRAEGKLSALDEKLINYANSLALTAIGHTRWATHGVPVERNAHPHLSNDNSIAIVHNGIIENYQQLKEELQAKGYRFQSETDTEVLVNLIAEERKSAPDLQHAFASALRKAEGAYAVALIEQKNPNTIWAARMSAPLLVGIGKGEHFIASDIPAFLPYTRDVMYLDDGEMACVKAGSVTVYAIKDLAPLNKAVHTVDWDVQAAQKGGFKHYMLKEIFEQPQVINQCLGGRQQGQELRLPELDNLPLPKRLHIVACGTSLHAGMWSRSLFEKWAGIPVNLEIASEFRYREALLDAQDMVLVISQSGETADTLAGLRIAKKQGIKTLGLCNVVGSSIAREADAVVYTQAGPEISVASTKAMCSQMVLLTLLALYYGQKKGKVSPAFVGKALQALHNLPACLDEHLEAMHNQAKQLAKEYASAHSFFFLGRGEALPLALEGALKLKELSYIHAEGYAAGEMKHGPIAMIDKEFPTMAIALDDALYAKTKSNIAEIKARSGPVIALVNPGADMEADHLWTIPKVLEPFGAFMVLPALQLFSYEIADFLGKDVDQPRNLAKSVTVE